MAAECKPDTKLTMRRVSALAYSSFTVMVVGFVLVATSVGAKTLTFDTVHTPTAVLVFALSLAVAARILLGRCNPRSQG